MAKDYNILQENEKRYPRFNGFGEMSSERDTDLLEWYFEKRRVFPPVPILVHYLKQIYLFAKENDLLGKHRDEMEQMQLPFNFRFIPLDYPQPEYFQ